MFQIYTGVAKKTRPFVNPWKTYHKVTISYQFFGCRILWYVVCVSKNSNSIIPFVYRLCKGKVKVENCNMNKNLQLQIEYNKICWVFLSFFSGKTNTRSLLCLPKPECIHFKVKISIVRTTRAHNNLYRHYMSLMYTLKEEFYNFLK